MRSPRVALHNFIHNDDAPAGIGRGVGVSGLPWGRRPERADRPRGGVDDLQYS